MEYLLNVGTLFMGEIGAGTRELSGEMEGCRARKEAHPFFLPDLPPFL